MGKGGEGGSLGNDNENEKPLGHENEDERGLTARRRERKASTASSMTSTRSNGDAIRLSSVQRVQEIPTCKEQHSAEQYCFGGAKKIKL